jgi:subtilisin-like proprotein convertase family protein
MSNSSTCATTAPGPLSIRNRYSNYTSGTGAPAAPNVFAGAANPVSVQIGTCGGNFGSSVAVFIDLNQDGDFIDLGERVFGTAASTAGPHTATGLMNIPATATLGPTRMRVVNVETGNSATIQPCGTYTWGETEDYNVNIAPCVQGVFTTVPASTSTACGSNASFTVAGTGSLLTFSWQFRVNATSAWQTVLNGGVYSGATTATLTLTNVPATMSGYEYRALMQGGCTAIDFSSPPATLTVTPLIATTNIASATICTGSIQTLTLTNASSPTTTTYSSGTVNIPIPEGTFPGPYTGASHVIPVSGIPAGAVVTNMSVRLNANHPWVSDCEIVLRAPNGNILNLVDLVTATNQSGANFVNTVLSSSGTAELRSGIRPGYTGTFRPDAVLNGAFGIPAGPIGFLPNVTTFASLYSVLNGNWTLAFYDAGAPDIGTLVSWSLDITYGAPATGVWTAAPAAPNTMFTDAAATVPYVAGSQATTIYVNPTVNTSYSVVYTSSTPCVTPAKVIPVNVTNPVTGVVNPSNTAACIGNTATFTVSASGGPLTYQWQVSTAAVPAFTNISGATSATLSVDDVTASMNGNQYRCVITAAPCGSVNSGAATLTVNSLPNVNITAPLLQLTPGLTTTITATPAGASSYVWRRDGALIGGPNTNTRLAAIDSIGTYSVTVTDANGCVNGSNSLTIGTSASDRLWIYPNPTTGVFQVRYYYNNGSVISERRVIQLYNSAGVAVMTKIFPLDNTQSPYLKMDFDVSKLSAGIYIVKVLDQFLGSTVAGKLIVER